MHHKDVALWGSIIVSVIVLGLLAAVVGLLFMIPNQIDPKDTVPMVVGGLMSMASGVVGFWVGSSVSSARKDAAINKLTETKP